MKHLSAILILIYAACSACSSETGNSGQAASQTDVAIPRPTAYPRPTIYSSEYVASPADLALNFDVNSSAEVEMPHDETQGSASQWLNIHYPKYGATLSCTFMPVTEQTKGAELYNRRERMRRDFNGITPEETYVESPAGFNATIFEAPHATITPLEFIAADEKDSWLVWGALWFANPPDATAIDSVAPYISAVKTDLIHALEHIDYR